MHGIVEDTTSGAEIDERFHATGSVGVDGRGSKPRAPRKQKSVRLCDIAQAAGVSIATVSLVLSENPRISGATQQRVRKIAHRLGYRPMRAAQVLAGRTSTALAVLLPAPQADNRTSISDAYFGELVNGVTEQAAASGYTIMFDRVSADFVRRRQHIGMLEDRAAAGMLLLGFNDHHRFIDDFDTALHPIVVVDNKLDRNGPNGDCDFVGCDYRGGAQQAMNYLLQLGHRKIGLIASSNGTRNVLDIVAVYRAAMADHGIRPGEGFIADGQFNEAGGDEAADKILRRHSEVTAILAACDSMAIGAIHAAVRRGRSVPRDLSVVGFGNLRHAAFLNPALTTVQLPLQQVGARACQRLIERINGQRQMATSDYLPTHLILRSSSAIAHDVPRADSSAA
jgi:LacI family transcriptional regulator